MTCNFPSIGFTVSNIFTNTGKLKVFFIGSYADNYKDNPIGKFQDSKGNEVHRFLLPCGKCIGCKLDRAKTWALRCMHEVRFHNESCWLTLTYNDDRLPRSPENGHSVLCRKDLQKFIKRLRKAGHKFKYFGCGEYGDTTGRSHYHLILFGYRPKDLVPYKESSEGYQLYNSDYLEKKWKNGFVVIADVSFDTAGYTARYSMKKHFKTEIINPNELIVKPFLCMSTKPAIGKEYFETYGDNIFENDKCVYYRLSEKYETKPPRYYQKLLEQNNPVLLEQVKEKRLERASVIPYDRLYSKEIITEQKMNKFKKRNVE